MTSMESVYRRLVRRETHSSRSGAAVLVAALLAAALIAGIAFGIRTAADAAFRDAADAWILHAADGMNSRTALIVAGVAAVLIAIVLLIIALSPGRRARHARVTERIALIVDDAVLADAAADAVARRCAIDRSQVSTTMARRSLTVRVTPTSGVRIDRDHVADVAVGAIAGAGFETRAVVEIAQRGVIA